MKSFFYLLAVLVATAGLAQQARFSIKEGGYPINRIDSILWIDVAVANDSVVKDMVWDVEISASTGAVSAEAIPARPVLADNSTDTNKWTSVVRVSDSVSIFHYQTADKPSAWLPISAEPRKVMEFFVKFNSGIPLYGDITIKFFKIQVVGVDGAQPINLTADTSVSITIHLGGKPPDEIKKDFNYSVNAIVDSTESKVYLDFSYTGVGWHWLAFNLYLPDSVWMDKITTIAPYYSGYKVADLGSGNYRLYLRLSQMADSASKPEEFLRLVLRYGNINGKQNVLFDSIAAKKDTLDLVVKGPSDISFYIDRVVPSVKFQLAKATDWLTPVAILRSRLEGALKLNLNIENKKEYLKKFQFQIQFPDYLDLSQVTPLDANGDFDLTKVISLQKLSSSNGLVTYQAGYEALELLSPGSQAVVGLRFSLVDLPAGQLLIRIDSLIAVNQNNRPVNENAQAGLIINLLEEVYVPHFTKGDVDKQWGDGALTKADADTLIRILNGDKIPTMYQGWAGDLNGDGRLNLKDLDSLNKLLQLSAIPLVANTGWWEIKNTIIKYKFNDCSLVVLTVYDQMGRLLMREQLGGAEGSFDLENLHLHEGFYLIRLNETTDKILIY